METLSEQLDVCYLSRFTRELDPVRVFPRWMSALTLASRGDANTFFEDECGAGFGEWMNGVPVLGGPRGLQRVADVIVP